MKSLKPHAFIRISDGKVFIPHPTEPDRWIEQFMFEKFKQMGWDHWTTSLFMQFVAENSFYVAYDQAEMDMYSELCIANKTQAAYHFGHLIIATYTHKVQKVINYMRMNK